MDKDETWKNYINILNDSTREKEFVKITNDQINEKKLISFLYMVFYDDPNPHLRIKAAKLLLEILNDDFIVPLIKISQTDPMLEGYLGLIELLKPYLDKHSLPYNGLATKPWVLEKMIDIYQKNEK